MNERWSGDGRFYLPARQVAPYRLWFEFLKRHLRNEQEFLNLMNLVIHLGPLSFQRIQFV